MQLLPEVSVDGLEASLPELAPWLVRSREAVAAAHAHNAEGGDPGHHGDPVLLARHLGHYMAAAGVVAGAAGRVERLIDVGCGTGVFTGWLGERLGAAVEVVDHDPAVRAAAAATVGGTAHADLAAVAPAPLVTAMEVLEHVPPEEQTAFCHALLGAVAPGGLLVLSTPDESLYPGGSSGYAPHVGCVTGPELEALLRAAGGTDVTVLRLTGGPFHTGVLRRAGEAVGNRAWTLLRQAAPAVAGRLEGGVPRASPDAVTPAPGARLPGRARRPVTVTPAALGAGGSLVAVVARPAEDQASRSAR